MTSDSEKFINGLTDTLVVQLPGVFTAMGEAMNGGMEGLKSVFKNILNMVITSVEGIVLAAAAAMSGKAITSFGVTLLTDAPLLAAAYAGLEVARGFINSSFASGGINTRPGVAMLHGTERDPEYIFNTKQMKSLMNRTAPLRTSGNQIRVVVSGEFVQRGRDLYSVVKQRDEHYQRSTI